MRNISENAVHYIQVRGVWNLLKRLPPLKYNSAVFSTVAGTQYVFGTYRGILDCLVRILDSPSWKRGITSVRSERHGSPVSIASNVREAM